MLDPFATSQPIAHRKVDRNFQVSLRGFQIGCPGATVGTVVELVGDPANPPVQWRTGPGKPLHPCRINKAKSLAASERTPLPPTSQGPAREADRNFLRALRGGPMSAPQIAERYPTNHPATDALVKSGWVRRESYGNSSVYHLTDEGRAVCPPRNPASTKPRHIPLAGPDIRNPTGRSAAGRRHAE